jgi:hypothetical protein
VVVERQSVLAETVSVSGDVDVDVAAGLAALQLLSGSS